MYTDVCTKTEIDTLIANINRSNYYAKPEIDDIDDIDDIHEIGRGDASQTPRQQPKRDCIGVRTPGCR